VIPSANDTLVPKLEGIIKDLINEIEDSDSDVSKWIREFVSSVESDIEKEWEKTDRNNDILDGIDFQILPNNIYDGLFVRSPGTLEGITNSIDDSNMRALISNTAAFGGAAVIGIIVLKISLVLLPLVLLVLPVGMIVTNFLAEKKVRDALEESWHEVEKAIYKNTKMVFRNDLLIPIISSFQEDIESNVDQPRSEYERRRKFAEARWQKADNVRFELAEKAKRIRTKSIAPLREKIDCFLNEANKAFPLK